MDASPRRTWSRGNASTFDSISRQAPDSFPPQTHLSWSKDGSAVVYSKASHVFTYTLKNGKVAVLTAGTMPDWSPRGDSIAFRSPEGRAAVMSLPNRSIRVLMPTARILWGLRWSPDGDFVLASVARPDGGLENGTELAICRVFDGSTLKVNPLVGGSTDERVYWNVKPDIE